MRVLLMCLSLGIIKTIPGCAQAPNATRPLPSGRALAAFMRPGYDTLKFESAIGELNQDSWPDRALVLRPTAEDTATERSGELPPRVLLLLFGTPTGYVLAAQSAQLLLCKECGGQFEPLGGLNIAKGVLTIDQMGGGSERWSISSKFRYQKGAFYLIGETISRTQNGPMCPIESSEDTNFITGVSIVTTTLKSCEIVTKRMRRKPAPLRQLVGYEIQP